ncbi:MAG TPA: hypothetical protein VK475_11135 [Pyrinomonadaceae bacterium]|nr:hypothetical protein [Pyrinomonadaceae bacterium]
MRKSNGGRAIVRVVKIILCMFSILGVGRCAAVASSLRLAA